MPRECAFCPATANLSAEHVFSEWMDRLFPGKKYFHNFRATKSWASDTLDFKARVVCEKCNNTWMSNIESQHAKPSMTDLMVGKQNVPISQSRAHSIALFAFKTAVIMDHVNPSRHIHFFSRKVRYRFRETRDIPPNVMMWMAGHLDAKHGGCFSIYHNGQYGPADIHLYVCNYVVGHLAFQVVAEQGATFLALSPKPGYENLAVGFWPTVPNGLVWPLKSVLKSTREFRDFGQRWSKLTITVPGGGLRHKYLSVAL
jgi:hypothetical protein